jgi:predicted metalloprotease with PDZ domain
VERQVPPPAGLVTRDYQEPMRGDLLWIYEGLTEYLGWVLTGRSGLASDLEERESLASTAALMDAEPGRQWRSLGDTAVAAQVLYDAPSAWGAMRRSVDYYPEGMLVWLDADVLIRQKTGGKASLDDFCLQFLGGKDGPPEVRAYDLDDVVRALDKLAPSDWRAFFDARVQQAAPHAPMGGITGGGWKLTFDDNTNIEIEYAEKSGKFLDATFTLGMVLGDHGDVLDVLPGKPAAVAGLSPGMHVVAIDGRRYTDDGLHDAVVRTSRSQEPMHLLVENGDFYKVLDVTWHGGEQHPHLERDATKPDLLAAILAPRTPRPPEAVASTPTREP